MSAEIKFIPPEIEGAVPKEIMENARLLAEDAGIWKVEIVKTRPGKYEVKDYHRIVSFITPKEG